ncbi:MAG: O-antigen ligase family protein [Pseudonocardiaceae bacterium]
MVPLLGVTALLAGSRGGAVAAVITTVIFVVLHWRRLSWRVGAPAVACSSAGVVAAVSLFSTTDAALIQKRFVSDIFHEHQFSGRPELFGQALKIFVAHPLFGGGLDSFYTRFGYSEDLGYPHNLLVEVAATGGMVGLGLLVAFTVSLVRHVRPRGQVGPDQLAMLMGVIFVATAGMFSGDLYDSRFLWIFAVLAVNHRGWTTSPRILPPEELQNWRVRLRNSCRPMIAARWTRGRRSRPG